MQGDASWRVASYGAVVGLDRTVLELGEGQSTHCGERVLPTRRMDSKRVANQAIFRDVNNRIQEINEPFSVVTGLDPVFVCECSDLTCVSPISVTLSDYRGIRENEGHFIVTPDHVERDLVRIVDANESYVVVALRD